MKYNIKTRHQYSSDSISHLKIQYKKMKSICVSGFCQPVQLTPHFHLIFQWERQKRTSEVLFSTIYLFQRLQGINVKCHLIIKRFETLSACGTKRKHSAKHRRSLRLSWCNLQWWFQPVSYAIHWTSSALWAKARKCTYVWKGVHPVF